MKTIALALLVACSLVACKPSHNYAVDAVHAVDSKADCASLYVGAGDHHQHSAVCTLADQSVLYCATADNAAIACTTLKAPPPPVRQVSASSPQPAAAPLPPAPAPAAAAPAPPSSSEPQQFPPPMPGR